jgi:pimeloyl-ACP methyl ester carboxylesterase
MTSHSINYVELGDPSRPALLLVHGFGASSYHWRHNIPTLARDYHVYALDLLGFGWSDKPIMDYDASVWRDQVVDFVREVILSGIAGNSLGGFTAMYASSDDRIKERVGGCILLNAAGRFRDPTTAAIEEEERAHPIARYLTAALQRFVIACSFAYTKRPARIEQILRQVYPVDDTNVDDELVASIYAGPRRVGRGGVLPRDREERLRSESLRRRHPEGIALPRPAGVGKVGPMD